MPSETLDLFKAENCYVDYSNTAITRVSNELFAGIHNATKKVQTAYEYVRDKIPHSFDIQAKMITSKASDVLINATGICHAKANLLSALLRSQDIPAGFGYQHITLANDDTKGYCLHCFNAVYICDRWIFLDARGNTNGKNAQFSLDAPILAFSNRADYDEYCFQGIWAYPDEPTMRLLSSAKDLQAVVDGLPEYPFTKANMQIEIPW